MMDFITTNILSFIIFLPLVSGVLILLFLSDKAAKIWAFLTTIAVALLGVVVYLDFDPYGGMQFNATFAVVESYAINYSVGIDGINLFILLIIAFAFPPLFLILKRDEKGYWVNTLLMQSGFLAVVCAKDLVFFYAGWEMMLLPIFFMIGIYGKDLHRARAAMDMMYYTIFGSMIMLGAIIYIGASYYEQFGVFSFDIEELSKLSFSQTTESVLFFCFMLAFAIKVPLFPLHLWMAKAYTNSLTSVTFMLSVIASKVAVFAIFRFVLPLFENAFIVYADLFVWLGLFSMLYFGVAAITSKDFKTLLAYASASHLGLIIAGIFALDVEAFVGTMYQLTAHAMSSGIMFLLVGKISEQLGTRQIKNLGGIAIKSPIFAFIFGIAMISSVGLPGTVGFVGELLILFGLFKSNLIYGVVGTTSIVAGAIYIFMVYRRAILQGTNSITANFKGLKKAEVLAFLIPVVMIFVLGLYPKPFTSKIEPTMQKHYELYIKQNLGSEK